MNDASADSNNIWRLKLNPNDTVEVNPRIFITDFLLEIDHLILELEKKKLMPSYQLPKITWEDLSRKINIYDKGLEFIPFKVLKALIIHDLKGIITGFNVALTLIQRDSFKDINEMITQLRMYRSFVSLGLIGPFQTEYNIANDFLLDFLLNSYCRVVQVTLHSYGLVLGEGDDEFITFIARLGEEKLSSYGWIIWPIHTVVLNMIEKGAKIILMEANYTDEKVLVRIHDDIRGYGGLSGAELVADINKRIHEEPKTRTDTGDLLAQRGLPIARVLLDEMKGNLWCEEYKGHDTHLIKTFFIELPR